MEIQKDAKNGINPQGQTAKQAWRINQIDLIEKQYPNSTTILSLVNMYKEAVLK